MQVPVSAVHDHRSFPYQLSLLPVTAMFTCSLLLSSRVLTFYFAHRPPAENCLLKI